MAVRSVCVTPWSRPERDESDPRLPRAPSQSKAAYLLINVFINLIFFLAFFCLGENYFRSFPLNFFLLL